MEITINAFGHPNIRSKHRSTWQLTKEAHLTPRGDCIVGISADSSAKDLPDQIKSWLLEANWISIELQVGDFTVYGKGQGHPDLLFQDPIDMVFRRSDYICPRTICINSTLTAHDLPNLMVEQLQDPTSELLVKLAPID